jgi:acetyl-CoA acetyltransferase
VGLAKGRAVGLLQLAFEELAGLGARELLDKLDGTRRLEMCQSLAHVADDLLAKFGLPEVSTDGGLIGRGHPGGPTGTAQIWETVRRLREPNGDRVGLCHLLGGGSICIVQIYQRNE